MAYKLEELIHFARVHSPFYKNLYSSLPSDCSLTDLPIVDSSQFWTANRLDNNLVLTGPQDEGILFKSGGTSGQPKFSFFTNSEWHEFTAAFGWGLTAGGLRPNERVANLFYSGDLYASFIFIMKSLEASPSQVLQLPIAGNGEAQHILESLDELKAETWAGVPTSIVKLAQLYQEGDHHRPNKILFGGESLYPDQRQYLEQVFPKTQIQSVGYASVDGGLLGYADSTCGHQEHRVFSDHTIIEIVDETTLEPIHEVGRPGKIVLTNLTRRLMPILRYPVGDLGQWLEEPQAYRKFKILGRSEEGARVGPATVYYEDVAQILNSHPLEELDGQPLMGSSFQLILKHHEQKDQLIIRIALAHPPSKQTSETLTEKIVHLLEQDRPALRSLAIDKQIHPVRIEFTTNDSMLIQTRTGKLKRLIDQR